MWKIVCNTIQYWIFQNGWKPVLIQRILIGFKAILVHLLSKYHETFLKGKEYDSCFLLSTELQKIILFLFGFTCNSSNTIFFMLDFLRRPFKPEAIHTRVIREVNRWTAMVLFKSKASYLQENFLLGDKSPKKWLHRPNFFLKTKNESWWSNSRHHHTPSPPLPYFSKNYHKTILPPKLEVFWMIQVYPLMVRTLFSYQTPRSCYP